MGINFNSNQPNYSPAPQPNAGQQFPSTQNGQGAQPAFGSQTGYDASQFSGDSTQPSFDGSQSATLAAAGKNHHILPWVLGIGGTTAAVGGIAYAMRSKNSGDEVSISNERHTSAGRTSAQDTARAIGHSAAHEVEKGAFAEAGKYVIPFALGAGAMLMGSRALPGKVAPTVVKKVMPTAGKAGLTILGASTLAMGCKMLIDRFGVTAEGKAKVALRNIREQHLDTHSDWAKKIDDKIDNVKDKAGIEALHGEIAQKHQAYFTACHDPKLPTQAEQARQDLLAKMHEHYQQSFGKLEAHKEADKAKLEELKKAHFDKLAETSKNHLTQLHDNDASFKQAANEAQCNDVQTKFEEKLKKASTYPTDFFGTDLQAAIDTHRDEKIASFQKNVQEKIKEHNKTIDEHADEIMKKSSAEIEKQDRLTELEKDADIKKVLDSASEDDLKNTFKAAHKPLHPINHIKANETEADKKAREAAADKMKMLEEAYLHKKAELAPTTTSS